MNAELFLDSKKCEALAAHFANTWRNKKAKPQARVDALQAVFDAAFSIPNDQPIEEAPRRAPHPAALRQPKRENVQTGGNLGDPHDLPFDPFQHKEPDIVQVRLNQLDMLKESLAKLPAVAMGVRQSLVLPDDFNPNDAPFLFAEIDNFALAEQGITPNVGNMSGEINQDSVRAGGWLVRVIRTK